MEYTDFFILGIITLIVIFIIGGLIIFEKKHRNIKRDPLNLMIIFTWGILIFGIIYLIPINHKQKVVDGTIISIEDSIIYFYKDELKQTTDPIYKEIDLDKLCLMHEFSYNVFGFRTKRFPELMINLCP